MVFCRAVTTSFETQGCNSQTMTILSNCPQIHVIGIPDLGNEADHMHDDTAIPSAAGA